MTFGGCYCVYVGLQGHLWKFGIPPRTNPGHLLYIYIFPQEQSIRTPMSVCYTIINAVSIIVKWDSAPQQTVRIFFT